MRQGTHQFAQALNQMIACGPRIPVERLSVRLDERRMLERADLFREHGGRDGIVEIEALHHRVEHGVAHIFRQPHRGCQQRERAHHAAECAERPFEEFPHRIAPLKIIAIQ